MLQLRALQLSDRWAPAVQREAFKEYDKLVAEKVKKGYVEKAGAIRPLAKPV